MTFSDILENETADKVIIFEDDNIFGPEFNCIFKKVIEELPEDFAICYLGCYLQKDVRLKKYGKNLIEILDNTRKITGTHAILFNKKYYKEISEKLKSPKIGATDAEIAELLTGRARCFFVDPIICSQNGEDTTLGHCLDFMRFERDHIEFVKNNLME